MLFISKYKVKTEFMKECVKRFVNQDADKEFPEGLNLIGRYHAAGDTWE